LQKQISALAARSADVEGRKIKFDDESRALYDAVAQSFRFAHFEEIIGSWKRKSRTVLVAALRDVGAAVCDSEGKTRTVFQLAIKDAAPGRWRTLRFPPNESSPLST